MLSSSSLVNFFVSAFLLCIAIGGATINFSLIALNVTKLRSDNIDPREYLGRLEDWQSRGERTGGEWRVINDLDSLEGLLQAMTNGGPLGPPL